MGLFDKKYCDICGEKIGFLGNRKLEDGNLCKDCAGKLSPFFSDRRNSTIEEIKAQLAYREDNRNKLAGFCRRVLHCHRAFRLAQRQPRSHSFLTSDECRDGHSGK